MSGIFGIYHRDQHPVDSDTLIGIAACMKHRGPDGSDIWHDGHTGMGHCMLQTTPESLSEKIPYINDEIGLDVAPWTRYPQHYRALFLGSRIDAGNQVYKQEGLML